MGRKRTPASEVVFLDDDQPIDLAQRVAEITGERPAMVTSDVHAPGVKDDVPHAPAEKEEIPDAPALDLEIPAGHKHYFVRLHCPTPIATPEGMHLAARNDSEAKAKFCDHNGLSGSDHDWTVRVVE
jgi:hypothetical protein